MHAAKICDATSSNELSRCTLLSYIPLSTVPHARNQRCIRSHCTHWKRAHKESPEECHFSIPFPCHPACNALKSLDGKSVNLHPYQSGPNTQTYCIVKHTVSCGTPDPYRYRYRD